MSTPRRRRLPGIAATGSTEGSVAAVRSVGIPTLASLGPPFTRGVSGDRGARVQRTQDLARQAAQRSASLRQWRGRLRSVQRPTVEDPRRARDAAVVL